MDHWMDKDTLVRQIQAVIDDCEEEFTAEGLDFDDDALISLEVTVEEASYIIKALKK
jgi:hypothetical protein